MAEIPAILRARNAAQVQRVLRRAAAQPALDFAPSHLIVGHAIRAGAASDLIGSWHLTCEERDTLTARASFGQADGFYVPAMRVESGSTEAWTTTDTTAWNFSTYFAVLMVVRFVTEGSGGYFIGNLKGPDIGDPHPLGGTPWISPDFGNDLGWGISANGGGGFGVGLYGDAAEPGRFDINNDAGGINLADGAWRVVSLVYDNASPNVKLRAADTGAFTFDSGTPGVTTSTDGLFRFGACNYFGNRINTATIEIAALMAFEGAAVANVWAHDAAIVRMLQADIDAAAA